MVSDLFAADPSGGILPVMQVVCRDLYKEVRDTRPPKRITTHLYEIGVGFPDGSTSTLDSHCEQPSPRLNGEVAKSGERVTMAFCPSQASQRRARWNSCHGCQDRRQPFNNTKAVEHNGAIIGSPPRSRPTRSIGCTPVFGYFTCRRSAMVNLYSLGHDAIALALYKWTLQEESEAKRRVVISEGRQRFEGSPCTLWDYWP